MNVIISAVRFLTIVSNFGLSVADIRHNNCVTWRDDLLTLTITCRVANIYQPITISHEESGTYINCSIAQDKRLCYPPGKNITVDRHNHTITIDLLELKKGRSLQGRWQCTQGETILYTNVSFSEGMITDPWVYIRGEIHDRDDGKKDIIVECISCRKPKGNYVEFLVNNKSHGSMVKNIYDGICRYKLHKCHPSTCNCSSTGNMFSLRLPLTNDSKDFACVMNFHDVLRKGRFRTTARMKITEEVALFDDSIIDVVVKNRYTDTVDSKNKTVVHNKTASSDNQTTSKTFTYKGLSTSLTAVITVCTTLMVTAVMSVLGLMYRLQKRKGVQKSLKECTDSPLLADCGEKTKSIECQDNKSRDMSDMNVTQMDLKFLEQDRSFVSISDGKKTIGYKTEEPCETCKGTINNRRYLCLNCDKKICSECNDIHDRFPLIKKHVIVKLEDVPVDFSLPVFCYKHTDDELKFVCITEGKLICEKCKESGHDRCALESLNTHNVSKDDYYLFKISVLKRLRTLEFYEDSVNLKKDFRSKMIPGTQWAETGIETADIFEESVPSKIKDSDSKDMKELLSTIRNVVRNIDFIENINNLDSRIFNIHFYLSKEKIMRIKTTEEVIKGNLSGGGVLPFETSDEKGKNDIKNKQIKEVSRRNTVY